MSAGYADVSDVIDSSSCRANHAEFPFNTAGSLHKRAVKWDFL